MMNDAASVVGSDVAKRTKKRGQILTDPHKITHNHMPPCAVVEAALSLRQFPDLESHPRHGVDDDFHHRSLVPGP
jgi:hypothetical protein